MTDTEIYELATTIPEYWNEHLAEKIAKIKKNQIKAGKSGTSVGLISDIHWAINRHHSAALLEKVLTDCAIPYYFDAGDIVSGAGICPPENIINDLIRTEKLFSRIQHKRLVTQGNHDTCYSTFEAPKYYAQCISASTLYNYCYRVMASFPDRCFGPTGTYYYVDQPLYKMRYIVLDTHIVPSDEEHEDGTPLYHKCNISLMQEELQWLANVTLDVPATDWSVILCTHEVPAETGLGPKNYDVAMGIIDAFRKHTKYEKTTHYEDAPHCDAHISCDFTGRGGNFIVWVGGHAHHDLIKDFDGIQTMTVNCDCTHNSKLSAFEHVAGTTTEQAFDILTVDKNNHKVYVTRIGCGEDREFEYEVF